MPRGDSGNLGITQGVAQVCALLPTSIIVATKAAREIVTGGRRYGIGVDRE